MRKDKKRVAFRIFQVGLSIFVALLVVGALVYVTHGREIPVFNTAGTIADQQRTLILITVGLGFFVVVPVFILLFTIGWRYRASNKKAKYEPDMEGHNGLELLWWGIPCLIILTLGIITVIATHKLDPYRPLESDVKPVNVEVVSLEWRWLFIYPEEKVATLNYLNIPEKTPINLRITSDAAMNSLWIPALAGQVYAMSGMSTKLHIMADSVGTYHGSTANISGEGYADMYFKVNSLSQTDFSNWVKEAAVSENVLNTETYAEVSKPTRGGPQTTYALGTPTLYDDIVMKYMTGGAR